MVRSSYKHTDQRKSFKFWNALSNRLGLKNFTYDVPEHAQSWPYMLGGITLSGFVILIITGIYLAQFYNPNQLNSNESVLYIISQAPFGNFARSVHFWASNLVFILVILHLVRTFITGSYKRPREFTWLAGLGLLGVTIGFLFTGTMLSLGQEGVEAMGHNSEAGLLLGKIGTWFTGGFTHSVPLIGRVYVAHITILGALFVLFMILHVYMIKIQGMSPKANKDALVGKSKEKVSHFSTHLKKLAGWSFILIAVVSLLALVWPESLSSPGVAGIEATKPPWMFLWIFGMEDVFGIKSLIWGTSLLFIVLAALPFIDRSPYLSPWRRKRIMALGLAIMIGLIYLSINAWRTPIMSKTGEGYVPRTVQQLKNFVFPMAYAHNMPFLSFSPNVVKPSQSVTISGDGLKNDGDYRVYLKSPQKTILLGVANVANGKDMFDADFNIPAGIPGDNYSVEMRSVKNPQFDYTATLQLSVQPATPITAPENPTHTGYPIPRKEIPLIIGLIVITLVIGGLLLFK